MSDLTQSGQHPDADQLTAFVEQALPPHEREQTLAHLATCAGCRTIVALSLPPLEETPAPQPAPARRPWFTSWHLAWPAAAAFAALAFVVIHLHNAAPGKSTLTTPTEIADSHPLAPLPVQDESQTSTPKPAPPLNQSPTEAAAKATGSKAKNRDIIVENESVADLPIANRNYTTFNTPSAAPPVNAINNQQAMDSAAPAAPRAQPVIPANRPQPGADTAAAPSGSKPRPAPQPAAGAATSLQADSNAIATLHVNGLVIDPNGSATLLPSHLPALSTAINGHQVLAIDTRNTLFYSDDDGKHWAAVPSQWRGRAVTVSLARPTVSLQQNVRISPVSTFGAVGGAVTSAAPTAPAAGSVLTGTITDSSGAVIPNTSITITNPTTRATRTATSDRNGRYVMDNLIPGNYQLEAAAPGFQKQQLAINLAAAQQNQVNLTLNVGAASETVEVSAAAQTIPLATPRAALKKSAPTAPAKPTTIPLFEIITDNGDRWTSPDGKTWRQK